MNPPAHDAQSSAPSRPAAVRASAAPLSERKRAARRAARARVAGRTSAGLSAAQAALDPLARGRRRRSQRLIYALVALLGSAVVHVLALGVGLFGDAAEGRRELIRQEIAVEVKEPPPPEPEPPPPPPPEPEPMPAKPVVKAPPPTKPEPPPEPESRPPPRVVGLSLDSTTAGGGGPAFAVGNTQTGKTADVAVAPEEVPAEAPPEAAPDPSPNRVARSLPRAGVARTLAKRVRESKPPYPEMLKQQGIEGDVTVYVEIDATGRVVSAKIVRPSPYPEFNEVALPFVRTEQYEPATRDGVPVPSSLSFTIRFRLEEQ